MPEDKLQIDTGLEPILETIVESNDQNAQETNGILEHTLEQDARNGAILENQLEVLDGIHEEVKKDKVQKVELLSNEETDDAMKVFFSMMKGKKGDKGDKGDSIKGETGPALTWDMLTDEQKAEIRGEDGYIPVKGVDYFDGAPGKKGDKGDPGESVDIEEVLTRLGPIKNGKDGKTGKAGKDGSPDTGEAIVTKLKSLKPGARMSYDFLDDTPDIAKLIRMAKQSSKTVSLVELDDVDLTGLDYVNGKYVLGSGSGGGGTWGSITGTLSDQTDLQTALDAKQATLVSGTNIKTINGASLLGSGDIVIDATVTLLDLSANSTSAPTSIYNMSAGIPVEFKTSAAATLLYLDETNERVGVGTASPAVKLHIAVPVAADVLKITKADDVYTYITASLLGGATSFTFGNGSGGTTTLASYSNQMLLTQNLHISSAGYSTVNTGSKLTISQAPTASANYGLVSLGSGAFDGATAGFFTGASTGTLIAGNLASGSTSDLMNLQVGGVSKFKVTNSGIWIGDGGGQSIYDGYGLKAFSFFYNQTQVRNNFNFGGGYLGGIIPFDGTTSSFPALKRSSATLEVKLADDSAFAVLKAASIQTVNGVVKRVITTTDDATAVIDVTLTDTYELSAVANNTTFSTTGTPVDAQEITIRWKDAGVSKTITWDAIFVAIGVTLPTATTASKWGYAKAVYNSAASKFHILAVGVEA